MKLKTFIFVAMFLLVNTEALAWTSKPILNIEDEAIPAKFDGSTRSLEEVRDAIAEGCRAKGWNPVIDSEKQINCSILVRGKHYAEVNIPFTESKYSILYSNSRVLEYDPDRQLIHRNYNKWVILLSGAIQKQFAN